MKISVLIPVYNYDLSVLFSELYEQVKSVRVDCEVICLDDGSEIFQSENSQEADKYGFEYILQENRGRSAARNKLAKVARGEWLLFLDCDSGIVRGDFLMCYLRAGERAEVVYGGTSYAKNHPGAKFALHWKYGRSAEASDCLKRAGDPYRSFKTNNFFVRHSIYKGHQLDEEIREYGYEDLLWALQLKAEGIPILHMDNPVLHKGLNSNEAFLQNTISAIDNLAMLYESGKAGSVTPLLKWYSKLDKLSLIGPFLVMYNLVSPAIMTNLKSSSPSLFLFNLFKLAALCRAGRKSKDRKNSE